MVRGAYRQAVHGGGNEDAVIVRLAAEGTLSRVRAPIAPSIPDYMEGPNSTRRCKTAALAKRLQAVADELGETDRPGVFLLGRAAWRLAYCARAGRFRTGERCGTAYCPRCARQTAIHYRRRLADRMRDRVLAGLAPHGFALLTLTVAARDPLSGHRALQRARAVFVRRRIVRSVLVGGEGHVQVEPARGADADAWNVHLHAIVELRCSLRDVDTSVLAATWTGILACAGARGRFDLRQRRNLRAKSFLDEAR